MAGVSKGESFWRNLIAHRERLKITVDEACQQAGVSRASFYHWQKRLREAKGTEQATLSSLMPVKIVDDRIAEITIELPGDIRVRIASGCDQATLRTVLQSILATAREQA
jgi:transposase